MTDLLSLPMQELTRWVTQELGEPKYRAKQLYDWLHKKQVRTFGEMSSLPAALRQRLGETAFIAPVESRLKLESQLDGTKKFLFALGDGNCVEAVWMEYHHGPSLCISTQVGCRMGCKFCASTLGGLVRKPTPWCLWASGSRWITSKTSSPFWISFARRRGSTWGTAISPSAPAASSPASGS